MKVIAIYFQNKDIFIGGILSNNLYYVQRFPVAVAMILKIVHKKHFYINKYENGNI